MKSRSELWLSTLDELGVLCSVDTAHDRDTVVSRIKNEGESFFTTTLPLYAKDLERSLAQGCVLGEQFEGFKRRRLSVVVQHRGAGKKAKKHFSGVPEFLGGFMDLIFDSTTEMNDWWYSELIDLGVQPPTPMRRTQDDADVARMATAIWAIRQLCLMFSKEKSLCSDDLIERSINAYVTHDMDLMRPLWTIEQTPLLRAVRSNMSEGH